MREVYLLLKTVVLQQIAARKKSNRRWWSHTNVLPIHPVLRTTEQTECKKEKCKSDEMWQNVQAYTGCRIVPDNKQSGRIIYTACQFQIRVMWNNGDGEMILTDQSENENHQRGRECKKKSHTSALSSATSSYGLHKVNFLSVPTSYVKKNHYMARTCTGTKAYPTNHSC